MLDLMLPGLDGMQVCRQLRPFCTTPILMLTAREDDIDQMRGLEAGAGFLGGVELGWTL